MSTPKNQKSTPPPQVPEPAMVYYVNDIGIGELDLFLIHERDKKKKKVQYRSGMICRNQKGDEIVLTLWEVPENIMDMIRRSANRKRFSFTVYSGLQGKELREGETKISKSKKRRHVVKKRSGLKVLEGHGVKLRKLVRKKIYIASW